MSGRGRPSKPQVLHMHHGTYRADRDPSAGGSEAPTTGDRDMIATMPNPPRHLNDWGRRLWSDLGPRLATARVLTLWDLPTFEAMCMHYGLYREIHEAITTRVNEATGRRSRVSIMEYLKDRNSQVIVEWNAMRQAESRFSQIAQQFGLTPIQRDRLKVQADTPEDEMDGLLDGAGSS